MKKNAKVRIGILDMEYEYGARVSCTATQARIIVGKLRDIVTSTMIWPELEFVELSAISEDELNDLVPRVFRRALKSSRLTDAMQVLLWPLAWYAHKNCGWPEPLTPKRISMVHHAADIKFRCPICGELWNAPQNEDCTEDRMISLFCVWLHLHGESSFHKGRTTKRHILRANTIVSRGFDESAVPRLRTKLNSNNEDIIYLAYDEGASTVEMDVEPVRCIRRIR